MQADIIKTFAAQDYYRQMLLIDADMLVAPGCPDLFDICRDKWGVATDLGMPEMDDAFHRRSQIIDPPVCRMGHQPPPSFRERLAGH